MPSLQKRFNRTELFIARHLRINPVQLPKPDLFNAEIAQAFMRLLDQIFRPPHRASTHSARFASIRLWWQSACRDKDAAPRE